MKRVMSQKHKKVEAGELNEMSLLDIRIRKVKVLQGRAREEANKQGLRPDDLIIVKTTITSASPVPEYDLEKINGDPVSYLLKRSQKASVNRS